MSLNTLVTKPSERPDNIDEILTTLKRYDGTVIKDLEDYLIEQCLKQFNDIQSNLALLKLYELNSEDSLILKEREDFIISILIKGLINYLYSDFSLYLHLLPPYIIVNEIDENNEESGDDFSYNVQQIFKLFQLLDGSQFSKFWIEYLKISKKNGNKIFKNINNFEDDIRLNISKSIELSSLEINSNIFSKWINININEENGLKFKNFIKLNLKWDFSNDGKTIKIPINKNNEVKPVIGSEQVKFEQLSRLIKKNFEL